MVQEPTNRANGLTVTSRVGSWRVSMTAAGSPPGTDGSLTVIANSFQGRRLNRPNDVVVKSDSNIYFTDPNHNIVPEQWDLQFPGVYP